MGKADMEHTVQTVAALEMGRTGAAGGGIGLAWGDGPARHDALRPEKTSGWEHNSSLEALGWREQDVAI